MGDNFMNIKRLTGSVLVLFALFCMFIAGTDLYKSLYNENFDTTNSINSSLGHLQGNSGPSTKIYFFYGSGKCPTCDVIKASATEAINEIKKTCPNDLDIVWEEINIEEGQNAKYITQYGLFSTTVVIQNLSDPQEWKRLDDVWELASNKERLKKYIKDQILDFVGGCS